MSEILEPRVRICVILGSIRPGNYTRMAVDIAMGALAGRPGIGVDLIEPEKLDLPFPGSRRETEDQVWLKDRVHSATGVILATPEYHGSFSSVMKLVIENLGFPSILSGKPVSLLGVAGGSIGAIKSLEQLRSVCSHVGAIVLPGPVSIANVRETFSANGDLVDESVRKRIDRLVEHHLDYIDRHVCPQYALEAMVRQQN